MKKINIAIFISVFLIIVLIFIYFSVNKEKPNLKITLKGSNMIKINLGETYKEDGYTATYEKEGDVTDKVQIISEVNYNKPGTYQITYAVSHNNVKTYAKRFITIENKNIVYRKEYDNIDNTKRAWWPGNKKDYKRPVDGAGAKAEELLKYNAYYMGPDEKVIYLTFDEGSLDTYVKEIVDVLNKNNVKATFFFCKGFIVKNPELIKHISKTGHSIGNHTDNHLAMPTLATESNFNKYLREIKNVEDAVYKITGKEIDKVYREPRGDFSYRSLQIAKDLGYSSYFWSASYLDFAGELSKEKALNEMKIRYHNGAIYLIHPNNKGNYLALDDFIKYMKSLGYKFDLVKNIAK